MYADGLAVFPPRCVEFQQQLNACRILNAQAHMLAIKFYMWSDNIKISLFGAHIIPLYATPLWTSFKKVSIHRL